MNTGRRFGRAVAVAAAALAALALAACGSSSDNATQLVAQTFSGQHHVNSGDVNLALTISLPGSTTINGPLSVSLGGPFQSRGPGKLPESNFTASLRLNGKTAAVSVLSTGTAGYVTLQGASYQLPPATFQKLESSFAQVASSGAARPGSGGLSKLGIRPLSWLRNPTIVGTEDVGGASTTHITAGVNVPALVDGLSTLLQKASSLNVSGAKQFSGGLSPAERNQIASAIRNPRFDLWTGKSDKTLRRLQVTLTLPISGQISTLAGGVNSANIGLTVQYSNINQPQTFTVPSAVRPFSEFQAKVQSFVRALQGGLGGLSGSSGASGSGGSSGASSGATGSSGSAASVQSYSQCIQAAGNDVGKMQKCASLLGGK